MILDLHLHSEASDDSRAPVEAYLKILARKRAERPLDGFVLTEHRKFDPHADYLAHALQSYRNGSRKNATMQSFAATLQPGDIEAIAEFYSKQQPALKTVPLKEK